MEKKANKSKKDLHSSINELLENVGFIDNLLSKDAIKNEMDSECCVEFY